MRLKTYHIDFEKRETWINMRNIQVLATIVFCLMPILTAAGCGSPPVAAEKTEVENVVAAASKPDKVELIYFHTKVACHCMMTVEDNIKYAVDTYFVNEIATGKVKLTMVVSDDPANVEIVKSYDAMPFVLFIKETRGNKTRIYPVSDIWNMTGDDNRDKLINFIRVTVTDILEGKNT